MHIVLFSGLTIILFSFLLACYNFYHLTDSTPGKVWKTHICSMVIMIVGMFMTAISGCAIIMSKLGV